MLNAMARKIACGGVFWLLFFTFPAHAQVGAYNLAPGFTAMNKASSIVVMPLDIELFSMSAGGVLEPKADWTESAQKNIQEALAKKTQSFQLNTKKLAESDSDDFAEISTLHAAVARSIALHHKSNANLRLPTKNNQLDWSLGEAVRPIKAKTGADYALFIWVRDSYASAERKVAMFALAFVGVGITGGAQTGYASLVDLETGQVMWFNRLFRASGDLRVAETAGETVDTLLAQFPAAL